MKKKILLILIFVLIATTGCTANYTLTYKNDTFTEYLEVSGDKEDDAHPTYNDILNEGLYADRIGLEQFTLSPDSTKYNVKLSHTLDNIKLKDLNAVSECFRLNTYKETDSSYYLSLYGGFTCPDLKDSTFILETDTKVLSHNASKVVGNQYIWNLTEEEVGEAGITFQMLKADQKETSIKTDTMIPLWLKILIGAVFIASAIGMLIFLKRLTER